MSVTLSKHCGFCFGVKRAISILEEELGGKIYTYGEIIHNPAVVEEYRKKGVLIANSPQDVEGGKVIIRSHGAGKEVIEQLEKRAAVIDATCVFVKKIHEIVREKHEQGYTIVIVGKRSHPEVSGINGWCESSAVIVDSVEEARALPPYEKLCVVVQTTYEKEKFEKILENIPKIPAKIVEVFDTICYTTIERQKEAEELSKNSDLMVVVGGRNSSNTAKLADVCRRFCDAVLAIEDISELDFSFLKRYDRIGVVAGASTPEGLIKEVFFKMADKLENQEVTQEVAVQAAGMTMDDVMKTLDDVKFKRGQKIEATISEVRADGLMLSIPGFKTDNFLVKDEICYEGEYNPSEFSIGDAIEVKVVSTGPIRLSKKAIVAEQIEEQQVADLVEGKKEFSLTFNEVNKGGLIGKLGTWSVFVPASQIRIGYISDFDKYKGKALRLEVIEFDAAKKKIVASQKVILEREKDVKEAEKLKREEDFWNTTEEGQIVEGRVVRISDFGAFVSVNGFDCLAHKSDLSWSPIEKVESVLEKNKIYQFVVLKLDRESKRVSLGYKQLQPHPWDDVAEKYPAGSIVKGTVARIVGFGAFVELEKGVDGLVHVSQICHDWIENPTDRLAVGQEVEARVLEVDPDNQKITLSIKALLPAPEVVSRPPRHERNEEGGEERREQQFNRQPRQPREKSAGGEKREQRPRRESFARAPRSADEDGPKSWIDSGSTGGASIGDMLKALNLDLGGKNED